MTEATELTDEIKKWFGDGEADVDLMLSFGVVTPAFILALWNSRQDSAAREKS